MTPSSGKSVKLKYPIKIAGRRFPKGLEVRLAKFEEVQKVWRNIQPHEDSTQIGVWFPDMPHPTLVHTDQLDFP